MWLVQAEIARLAVAAIVRQRDRLDLAGGYSPDKDCRSIAGRPGQPYGGRDVTGYDLTRPAFWVGAFRSARASGGQADLEQLLFVGAVLELICARVDRDLDPAAIGASIADRCLDIAAVRGGGGRPAGVCEQRNRRAENGQHQSCRGALRPTQMHRVTDPRQLRELTPSLL